MIDTSTLQAHLEHGTLIRKAWTGTDAQGRATACLLAALSPEAGKAKDPAACPATLMDPWLAHLTPWLDDSGTLEAWPEVVRRYAAVISPFVALPADARHRAHYTIRALCVREAMQHTQDAAALAACETSAALCERVAAGGEVSAQEWAAARAAARAAAWAAGDAARAAASAAAGDAASAAARAAAGDAARAAASAAASDAAGDAAWAAAGDAAGDAARAAAGDRLTGAILSVLEGAVANG